MLIVDFPNNVNKLTTSPLYQWDYGQVLKITGLGTLQVVQVHFCNRSCVETIVRLGSSIDDGLEVAIPDSLLEDEWDINAFIYVFGENCAQTIKHVQIPVIKRKKPEDYIDPIPPSAQTELEQMIAHVNETYDKLSDEYNALAGYVDGRIDAVDDQVTILDNVLVRDEERIILLEEQVTDLNNQMDCIVNGYPIKLTADATSIGFEQDEIGIEKVITITPIFVGTAGTYNLLLKRLSRGADTISAYYYNNYFVARLDDTTKQGENTYRVYLVENPSVYIDISVKLRFD